MISSATTITPPPSSASTPSSPAWINWAAAQPTEGTKGDGQAFADSVHNSLSGWLESMHRAYVELLDKHGGRFFGDLNPRVTEELLETEGWQRTADGLLAYDFDNKLRDWLANTPQLAVGLDQSFDKLNRIHAVGPPPSRRLTASKRGGRANFPHFKMFPER